MISFALATLYELRLRKEDRGWQVVGRDGVGVPPRQDADVFC
jgi:hypothetical protein